MAFIKFQLGRAVWAAYFLGRRHERNASEYPNNYDECMRLVAEQEAAAVIQQEMDIYSTREREFQASVAAKMVELRRKRQQEQLPAVSA